MSADYASAVVDFGWPSSTSDARIEGVVEALVAQGARAVRAVERPAGRLYLPASLIANGREARGGARALPGASLQPIRVTSEIPGVASGAPSAYHYVVETDVDPAAEDDFNAWYDDEHLAGLAAVPGTVRAVRYLRPGASPRYGACYDLAQRDAYGSEAWLAVRGTPWSQRVRPAFRNTTRTMYRTLPIRSR